MINKLTRCAVYPHHCRLELAKNVLIMRLIVIPIFFDPFFLFGFSLLQFSSNELDNTNVAAATIFIHSFGSANVTCVWARVFRHTQMNSLNSLHNYTRFFSLLFLSRKISFGKLKFDFHL